MVASGSKAVFPKPFVDRRPTEHLGEPFLRFNAWLTDTIRSEKIEVIVFEEVFRWPNGLAALSFGGLRGQMLVVAATHRILCLAYAVKHVRKFWTGNECADNDVMVAATLLKLPHVNLTDDGEATALATLYLHLNQVERDT